MLINNTKKEIKFVFDCKKDTALQVAAEMISDLKLDVSRKNEIADAIEICAKKHLLNVSRSTTPVSEDYKEKLPTVKSKLPVPEVLKPEDVKPLSPTNIPTDEISSPVGSPLALNLDKLVSKPPELSSAKVSPRKESVRVTMVDNHINLNNSMFDSYKKTDFPSVSDYVKSNNVNIQQLFPQSDVLNTPQSGILSNPSIINHNRTPLNAQGLHVRFPSLMSPNESPMLPPLSTKNQSNSKFSSVNIKKTTMQRSISHPNLSGNPFDELDKALSTTNSPHSKYGTTPNYTPSQTPNHSNAPTPSHYYYPNPPFSAAVSSTVSRESSPPSQTKSFYEQVLTSGNNLTESRELPRDPTLVIYYYFY